MECTCLVNCIFGHLVEYTCLVNWRGVVSSGVYVFSELEGCGM